MDLHKIRKFEIYWVSAGKAEAGSVGEHPAKE
jgi:hypothetical protein